MKTHIYARENVIVNVLQRQNLLHHSLGLDTSRRRLRPRLGRVRTNYEISLPRTPDVCRSIPPSAVRLHLQVETGNTRVQIWLV